MTAEKVAINAVMAGCKPEYMPVVVAAVEGIADPALELSRPGHLDGRRRRAHDRQRADRPRGSTSTAGDNLFGPGWRANATIGRALRLVMRNVIGSLPGLLDRGTLGHPGKYSYVIAENEAESPWTPLHVERGFRPEHSAVTVMAAEGPHQFYNQLSSTAEGILTTLCDDMRISGNVMGQPNYVVVIAGEHMRTIAADGWTKEDIRKFVFEHTQNTHRAPQAHRAAWRARSWPERRDHAAAAGRGARTTSSSSPRAGAPARSPRTSPAGRSRRTCEAVTKLINDRRA